jgi:TDG/mug DNA glycosylase family protein
MAPSDERELLRLGYGITNIVNFATGQARELSPQMLRTGAAVLRRKTAELRPRLLAVLGIDAYSKAFGRPGARASLQPEGLDGAELWVLPNPSGINAGYRMEDLVRAFSELRARAGNL